MGTPTGRPRMSDAKRHRCRHGLSRGSWLAAGAGLVAAAATGLRASAGPITLDASVSATEFGSVPMAAPIHALDKNGHHNVPPGPYTEPSEIVNFRGTVATAVAVGTARDDRGRRLTLGGAGTDVRLMQGEYVGTDGRSHRGTFTHL